METAVFIAIFLCLFVAVAEGNRRKRDSQD